MSLSRPLRFPILKLPYLCIESVIKSSDIFDIICFALLSQKTRRIVKSLKIPLNGIQVMVSKQSFIKLGKSYRYWYFNKSSSESLLNKNSRQNLLVLQKNAVPLYTDKTDKTLESYTDGNGITALKMAIEFLDEVFKCSVQSINIREDSFPESGKIGFKFTVDLDIRYVEHSPTLGEAESGNLNLLLENLEVTGKCQIWLLGTVKNFHCDPKLFKCKTLVWSDSMAWITREILLQVEVPRLHFVFDCSLAAEDIVSFVTNWFYSDNRKFEHLYIGGLKTKISLEEFRRWNALPFSGRNRIPLTESNFYIDFSKGLEIVRHDGLQATIHVKGGSFLFYIWHDQPAITQN